MSLIATCELCGANPFDYLTELDRHASEAATHPAAWMPWNYRETLAGLATPPGTASWPFLTPRGPGKPAAQRFCTLTGTVQQCPLPHNLENSALASIPPMTAGWRAQNSALPTTTTLLGGQLTTLPVLVLRDRRCELHALPASKRHHRATVRLFPVLDLNR